MLSPPVIESIVLILMTFQAFVSTLQWKEGGCACAVGGG